VSYPFVESPNRTAAPGRAIDVVVIHTMEIAELEGAAESCARWFANPRAEVSAHYGVDADTVIQCVREQDIAWPARGSLCDGCERPISSRVGGVTGYADVSVAFRKSDHWDPRPDFPWARFLRLARGGDVVERAGDA
jgi:N-acetyl-anhydromuramyl-L-alanine amidase AmpD